VLIEDKVRGFPSGPIGQFPKCPIPEAGYMNATGSSLAHFSQAWRLGSGPYMNCRVTAAEGDIAGVELLDHLGDVGQQPL